MPNDANDATNVTETTNTPEEKKWIEEEATEKETPTPVEQMIAVGMSKEEIADTLREVLEEQTRSAVVSNDHAADDYFRSFIKIGGENNGKH